MYQALIFYHSIVRWLVLTSLVYATYRAYKGYHTKADYSKADNSVRHWTATIAHVQLVIGIVLYAQSPVTKYFWKNFKATACNLDLAFFGLIHVALMVTAIIAITVGSALAKRKETDNEKFKTVLVWFSVALVFSCIGYHFHCHSLAIFTISKQALF